MNRGWLYVGVGAVFEVGWVVGFKHARGPLAWAGTVAAVVLSFVYLVRAAARMPAGTAYAAFTGLGTLGTVLVEMVVFGEPFRLVKMLLIALLLAGVIGLKTVTGNAREPEASAAERLRERSEDGLRGTAGDQDGSGPPAEPEPGGGADGKRGGDA